MPAPLILFAYNRPRHTAEALAALEAAHLAQDSELFVFLDYPKKPEHAEAVAETRQVLTHKKWAFGRFTLVERTENYGLARNIIEGVSHFMDSHGRAIVLEDDLRVAPSFLEFMNSALDAYVHEPKVFSVSGYNFGPALMPIPSHVRGAFYFSQRPTSWGWATWADRWAQVDWEVKNLEAFRRDRAQQRAFNQMGDDMADMLLDTMAGKLNSWYVRFAYAQFRAQGLSITPLQSYVQNIGFDGTGVHCGPGGEKYDVEIAQARVPIHLPGKISTDPALLKAVRRANRHSFKHKLKRRLADAGLVKW